MNAPTRPGAYQIEGVYIVKALREDDDLQPARGAFWGVVLGAALWAILFAAVGSLVRLLL